MTSKQKKVLIRIVISLVLFILLALFFHDFSGEGGDGSLFIRCLKSLELSEDQMIVAAWIEPVLYLIVYLIAGYDVLIKAGKNIAGGQVFDENFLMIVAGIGAFVIGEYSEGVAVMIFYQIGELFQSYAVGKSRQSITAMMEIVPEYANVVNEDGSIEEADPEDVEIGTVILIKPGEKVPIDCRVVEGDSYLDTSALTGESVPRHASVGNDILSGCVNGEGTLKCVTLKAYVDSAVSVILELVENAGSRKSRTEKFITKFAKYYTPVVTIGALLLMIIPSLITGNWTEWLRRACTFLVISCPCALVISVPLGFFGGIGAASKLGILVKGSNYLEAVSDAAIVAFDKTGTLTHGDFSVTQIYSVNSDEAGLLELAAVAEQFSNHPIALSILKTYNETKDNTAVESENISKIKSDHTLTSLINIKNNDEKSRINIKNASDAKNITGKGVSCLLDGKTVLTGNAELMAENNVSISKGINCDNEQLKLPETGTICHVAYDGKYAGYIVISDTMKENAPDDLAAIRLSGIKQTVMLTGDNGETAANIAAKAGVDSYFAELLPEDKVNKVEELMGTLNGKEKLIFVGDGINDAPVLIRSDIGIAMGSMGADAAIEAADIVIMDDDLAKLPALLRISKRTLGIVRQNIVFALGVKLIILILGALGIAGMWLAVFADVGVAVLAILNSMRALSVK
ncbi:MAG: heavy metal translocating P-type ATPase [Lachnospiraceae bacterium]|nr:heavy metal translocating P-type ATPase [Lachnospiraceae bacterium]